MLFEFPRDTTIRKSQKKYYSLLVSFNVLLLIFIITILIMNCCVYFIIIPNQFIGFNKIKIEFERIYTIIENICNKTDICD